MKTEWRHTKRVPEHCHTRQWLGMALQTGSFAYLEGVLVACLRYECKFQRALIVPIVFGRPLAEMPY
jgi:hypothetical protein